MRHRAEGIGLRGDEAEVVHVDGRAHVGAEEVDAPGGILLAVNLVNLDVYHLSSRNFI